MAIETKPFDPADVLTDAESVERLWEISIPLLEEPPPVHGYPAGSWGPRAMNDLIIVGGGLAGLAAATWCDRDGLRVVLLEREKFPRYHIGESLLPYGYFTLERLGVLDKMKGSHFTKKYSVQFVSSKGRLSVPFYFFQQLKHEASMTWQVLRSEFDQMLLDNAREKGAEVIEVLDVGGDDPAAS